MNRGFSCLAVAAPPGLRGVFRRDLGPRWTSEAATWQEAVMNERWRVVRIRVLAAFLLPLVS